MKIKNKGYKQIQWRNLSESRMLKSGIYDSQAWIKLKKAWIGYKIARNKGEWELERTYASVIQKTQKELGIVISSFPHLGMSAFGEKADNAKYIGDRFD